MKKERQLEFFGGGGGSQWACATTLLRTARELLATEGWVQGAWGDAEHGRCPVSALRDAHRALGLYPSRVLNLAVERLALAGGWQAEEGCEFANYIVHHNDSHLRTGAEALAWFDRAITLWESAGEPVHVDTSAAREFLLS